MDKDLLEEKVGIMLREIEHLADWEKRNRIVEFVAQEIEKEKSTVYINKNEITNIESDAIRSFGEISSKTINGARLDSTNLRTVMYIDAVVACLRRLKILNRIVQIKFDS